MNLLIGIWFYTSVIYQGQLLPRPSQDLKMYFSFISEDQNEIFYSRTGETGHCRRTAKYWLARGKIYQTVVRVDPENAAICSEDPDMQLGQESVSPYEIIDDRLHLHLPLGDEDIIFVWKKK